MDGALQSHNQNFRQRSFRYYVAKFSWPPARFIWIQPCGTLQLPLRTVAAKAIAVTEMACTYVSLILAKFMALGACGFDKTGWPNSHGGWIPISHHRRFSSVTLDIDAAAVKWPDIVSSQSNWSLHFKNVSSCLIWDVCACLQPILCTWTICTWSASICFVSLLSLCMESGRT